MQCLIVAIKYDEDTILVECWKKEYTAVSVDAF